MCLFDCKCKSLNRLGENNNKNIKKHTKTEKLREKQQKTEIQDIQPSTRQRIDISQVPAGR